LLSSRRTIHLFQPEVPPRETVVQALDLARWAPNHRLTEPWRFYLIGRETATAIAHLNAEIVAETRGEQAGTAKLERWLAVPGWMAVTCVRSDDPVRAREDYAACCCAVQNAMLYLWSEGIGVKWTTGDVTRDDRFFELLGVDPEAEALVGLFWYGYPAEIPVTRRRPLAEVLSALG
jgi:nitroreductase